MVKKNLQRNFEIKREDHPALRKALDVSDVMFLLMPDRFANGTK